MNAKFLSDFKLALAVASGAPEAKRAFVVQLEGVVRAYVTKRYRLATDVVDDLTQGILERALINAQSFRGDATLSTWVLRLARAHTCSILRAERCRRARQYSYASPPTDSSVRAHELREECAALVDSLSPDERALVLRRAWGWTLAEISEESGAQIATVRRRLAGVQSRLREGSR